MIFYGAGGHAKVVIEAWTASGGKVTAIFDDNESIRSLLGKSVNGKYNAQTSATTKLVVSIGINQTRRNVISLIRHPFGKIIHPSAIVSPSSTTDEGSVLMAGCVVQAETTIGKHCIINTSASVDHDCVISDYAHIAPGAVLCGNVTIGEGALVGAGATILPGVTIGKWANIGAGSVIIADVPEYAVVAGVPSRILRIDDPSLNIGRVV